jgi:hypothetical protein
MKNWMLGLFVTKMPAKVAHERINPDAFDGLCVAMKRIEFATSLRVPKMLRAKYIFWPVEEPGPVLIKTADVQDLSKQFANQTA